MDRSAKRQRLTAASGLLCALLCGTQASLALAQAQSEPQPSPTAARSVESSVALSLEADGTPRDAVDTISEQAAEFYIAVKLRGIAANTFSVEINPGPGEEGHLGNQPWTFTLRQRPNAWVSRRINAPKGGFVPGDYDLTIRAGEELLAEQKLKIAAVATPAELANDATVPDGFNVALAAFGGAVVAVSSDSDKREWRAANVIDGTGAGWIPASDQFPQDITLSFRNGHSTTISAVVLDPLANPDPRIQMMRPWNEDPKHVEVWVAADDPESFTRVTEARLAPESKQVIRFPATRASRVRLRILSNYGAKLTHLAELGVIETVSPEASIVADVPKNLAALSLGGATVQTPKQLTGTPAFLIDDDPLTVWDSAGARFPQDIVIAFLHDRVARIDSVVLNATRNRHPAYAVKSVLLSSSDYPLGPWTDLGTFEAPKDSDTLRMPVGAPVRFLRIRILANHGGPSVSLSDIQVFEGKAPGYTSILRAPGQTEPAAATAELSPLPEGIKEQEPNDDTGTANPLELGQYVTGTIDPLGERDFFRVSRPEHEAMVTVDLAGRPHVRTQLSWLDGTGKVVRAFDPGHRVADAVSFSWTVPGGASSLQLTDAPLSLILVWDTSGSMEGHNADLRRAVELFLDQVRPDDRINMIRFSHDVEVLLPEPTGSRERLREAATANKFTPSGDTALYLAIEKAIQLLEGATGNRAILLMTDGVNTGGNQQDLWRMIADAQVRVYAIGIGAALQTFAPSMGSNGQRFLTHLAKATNGRTFFSERSEDLAGFYGAISSELHAPPSYALRISEASGIGRLLVAATGERISSVAVPPRLEIVLDASGSMKRSMGGRSMIRIAQDAIAEVVDGLPDELSVALRAYGHRVREGQRGDCEDTEILVPFGPLRKQEFLKRVRSVRALGTTPIAYALRQTPRDFGRAAGDKVIILVTDGKEECGGDPAAVVRELAQQGFTPTVNVVGFALNDPSAKADMQTTAELTHGRYLDAADAATLQTAIKQSLVAPFEVLDAADAVVAKGAIGDLVSDVPEGIYRVRVAAADHPIVVDNVRVVADQTTAVLLRKEGEEVATAVRIGLAAREAEAVLAAPPPRTAVTPTMRRGGKQREPHPTRLPAKPRGRKGASREGHGF